MRKLWYAGAALTGGMFLFGAASPAQADLLPGTDTVQQQADQRLAYVLGEPNGVNVENPLRYSTLRDSALGGTPLTQFRSGNNSPDLNPMLPGTTGGERPGLPADDAVDSLSRQGNPTPVQVQELPTGGLLGNDGLVPLQNLLPSDPSDLDLLPSVDAPDDSQDPWAWQTEKYSGGMPLLGGLGGMLPVNSLPRVLPAGTVPDTSGLPTGGMTVIPADAPDSGLGTAKAQPADGAKAKDEPKSAATPDDPRLHEEPIDGEHRSFSNDVRPVAGIDRQYN
jgi:hypothetical protein